MQDKQKQIEEMAYSICAANRKLIKSCRECPISQGDKCPCVKKEFAEKFYNVGCRMQSDTAREILDEVSRHFGGAWLVKLYKKYGVEVEG